MGRGSPSYYVEPYKVHGELAQEKWDNALLHCIEIDQFKVGYTEKSYLNAACAIRRGDQYLIEINKDFDDNGTNSPF